MNDANISKAAELRAREKARDVHVNSCVNFVLHMLSVGLVAHRLGWELGAATFALGALLLRRT
jgi:hypothetical protein